jgi:hypothetical protein
MQNVQLRGVCGMVRRYEVTKDRSGNDGKVVLNALVSRIAWFFNFRCLVTLPVHKKRSKGDLKHKKAVSCTKITNRSYKIVSNTVGRSISIRNMHSHNVEKSRFFGVRRNQ